MEIDTKFTHLGNIISDMGSMLIAYSGGVDSTLLVKVAHDILGCRAVAATAISEIYPDSEAASAVKTAEDIGIRIIKTNTDAMDDEDFVRNVPDRCYFCKMKLFERLKKIADSEGLEWVIHGANKDDLNDYRPGQRAAEIFGVRAPLQEAGLTKCEIREISRRLKLSTWDKPSLACLASRFPYGTRITREALLMIEDGEKFLKDLGFRQVRIRHHDSIARIEVEDSDFDRLMSNDTRCRVVAYIKQLGYSYVTLDMEGYRTGSLNEVFERKQDG